MGRLDGKVAIITGSTFGIGEAAAHKFAKEGAKVLVVGRNEKQAENVAGAIVKTGGDALPCRTDVSKIEDAKNMVETAVKKWGRLDILVNNAAKTNNHEDRAVVDQDLEQWQRAFDVNVTGPLLCCKFAIPEMIKVGGGSIVNSGSGLGFVADTQWSGYACSKSALRRLSQHIAVTYGAQGIRSNLLVIGLTDTEAMGDMIPPAMREIMERNHLLGRFGTPDEMADGMVFLASDESSFITAAELWVDGGYCAHLPHMVQIEDWMKTLSH